jgi:hypothetical protein
LTVVLVVVLGIIVFEASHAIATGSVASDSYPAVTPPVSPVMHELTHYSYVAVPRPVAPPSAVPTTLAPTHPVTEAHVVHPEAVQTAAPAASHVSAAPVREAAAVAPSPTGSYGCGPAISYLSAYAAPGFHFECPGYALGHQAMTCINVAGVCPGSHLIVISNPCQAAYMNEASNSWVLEGLRQAPIDPYGYCH